MKQCNMTEEYATIHEIPLAGHHWLTFRRLILIVSSCFGLLAIIISLALIFLHATHYAKPWEQKHIIRILTIVPVYCILAWFSFMFYDKAVYISIAQLVYEAVVIASFYMLMCHWVAPDLRSQQGFFLHRTPKHWMIIRYCGARRPRDGQGWFNIISAAVLQYVVVRPVLALISLVTQATKRYCDESLSPDFAHFWTLIIALISTSIAMWGLASFYFEVRKELALHSPGPKFAAIKGVVFFTFFQKLIINMVTSSAHVQSTPRLAIEDLKIGLPAMLICLEMTLFSIMHIYTYSWTPYRASQNGNPRYLGGRWGFRAIIDAANIWDIVEELVRSWRWVFTRGKPEASQADLEAKN